MRAIVWSSIVLSVIIAGAAMYLGPDWTLGKVLDTVGAPAVTGARSPSSQASPRSSVAPSPIATPVPTPVESSKPGGPADAQTQSITISEDEINAYLSTAAYGQELANTPFGTIAIEDLRLQLRPEELRVTGTAKGGPGRLAFEIVGSLTVVDNTVRVIVRDAKVNETALPGPLRTSVEQALTLQIGNAVRATPIRVSAIEMREREIILRGTRVT